MEKFYNTFDIAAEVYDHKKYKGIIKRFRKYDNVKVEDLRILEKDNIFKKDVGRYVLIEAKNDFDDSFIEITKKVLKSIIKPYKENLKKVLIVGLGNLDYSPDALGPKVAKKINATMHLGNKKVQVGVLFPGVMADTGMETSEIIKAIVIEKHFDMVIAIDALATRHTHRLNRIIQITDTGLSPGAGIGNYRKQLNKEYLNVPVIAIGVATVVDSLSLVYEALDNTSLEEQYKRLIIKEISSNSNPSLFLTTKEIDHALIELSEVISKSINQIFGN